MKITLKLFVSLARFLPAGAKDNIVEIEVAATDSPVDVLRRLNVPLEQAHLWLLNGFYLEPDQRTEPVIKDGDTLAIWPPVAGG
jgi:sulfur-carrier protein